MMENEVLVALSPAEMPATQVALADWCDRKVALLNRELSELDDHRQIAAANGWKMSRLSSRINRTARQVTYYEKVKAAVQSGYLIVPNMPIDILAVRVKREKPTHATASYDGSRSFEARAELLPAGEGRYVDDRVFTRDESYEKAGKDGGTHMVPLHVSDSFDDEPDFPWQAVKPAVMDATARAMALKLFDEIGVVTNTSGRDPIMVGRLIDPRGGGRVATFFIAWWLDTASL